MLVKVLVNTSSHPFQFSCCGIESSDDYAYRSEKHLPTSCCKRPDSDPDNCNENNKIINTQVMSSGGLV